MRLLLIIPQDSKSWVMHTLASNCVPSWPKHVEVFVPDQAWTAAITTNRIVERAEKIRPQDVIVVKTVPHLRNVLSKQELYSYQSPSPGLLRGGLLNDRLESAGVLWRTRAETEIKKWIHGSENVERWLSQFETLGERWIGEVMLKLFEVIALSEIQLSTEIAPQDRVGKIIWLTYVDDGKIGSSGAIIKHLLSKSTASEFGKIAPLRDALIASNDGDELYFFEDGLWTSTEVRRVFDALLGVRQLEGVDALPDPSILKSRRIHLRYSAVTDYGLVLLRRYLRERDLTRNVDISSFEGQTYIALLPQTFSQTIATKMNVLDLKSLEDVLTLHVEPMCFQWTDGWGDRIADARKFCNDVGRQLAAAYSAEHGKAWSEEFIDQFALGAGRFGSTTTFAHSISKTSLPLFWTGSTQVRVTHKGKSLFWRPLLKDVRLASCLFESS